ncbi:MAG: hypothetical protein U0S36_13835 [Candidatus Nanopelagicales bacterium]
MRRIVDHVGVAGGQRPRVRMQTLFGTPTYAGVESVSGDAVFVRVTAKAAPDQQMTAQARRSEEWLKVAFDEAGIRVPVLVRNNLLPASLRLVASPAPTPSLLALDG